MKIPVTCMDCQHADLHCYDKDPILAACHKKPQPNNERFPFEIEIARLPRLCNDYDKDNNPKTIEVREKHQKTGELTA